MKINILNLDNVVVSELDLDDGIFGLEPRSDILARVVRWQLARRRSGNHQVKEEAEVSGSGKKIYKQKGTGSARQGSRRGPHFRKGAVIFGPHVRDHSFSLNKKVRRLGLKMALADKLASTNLYVYEDLTLTRANTKDVLNHFESIHMQKVLFIDEEIQDNFRKSIQNIHNFDVLNCMGANVYDILRKDKLILTKSAVKALEVRLK
jgi:large subunit ribosomal protein L4